MSKRIPLCQDCCHPLVIDANKIRGRQLSVSFWHKADCQVKLSERHLSPESPAANYEGFLNIRAAWWALPLKWGYGPNPVPIEFEELTLKEWRPERLVDRGGGCGL